MTPTTLPLLSIVAALAASSTAVAAPPPASLDVPTYRGDATRSGRMPGPAPVSKPVVRWRFQDRGPAIADGVIYQPITTGELAALSLRDGHALWRTRVTEGGVVTPAIADGRLYVGVGGADPGVPYEMIAVSLTDGQVLWRIPSTTGGQVVTTAVGRGTVFVVTESATVAALDAGDGHTLWTAKVDGALEVSGALVDDLLVVTAGDGSVIGLDAGTGGERWRVATTGQPWSPAVIDGRVIVGTSFGTVAAFGNHGPGSSQP